MKKSMTFLAAVAILALAVPTAGAAKKKGFKLGNYKATGAVAFNFAVTKNTCNNATGQTKKGYCFRAYGTPKVAMDCPTGEGYQADYRGTLVLPYNIILPKSGKLKVSNSTFYANGNPFATTEFNMTLKKNGRATGSITHTENSTYGTPTVCSSGKLTFSAKR